MKKLIIIFLLTANPVEEIKQLSEQILSEVK